MAAEVEVVSGEIVAAPNLEIVVAPLEERAVALSLQIKGLTITDEATDLQMAQYEVEAGTIRKQLKVERDSRTTPYNLVKQLIIDTFKPAQDTIEVAEGQAKRKRGDWYFASREATRKEEERLRKLAEAKNTRRAEAAEAKGLEAPAPIIPMPTVQEPVKTLRTAAGTSTIRVVWTWAPATSEEDMVRALAEAGMYHALQLDRGALKKLVDAGIREIPGAIVREARG